MNCGCRNAPNSTLIIELGFVTVQKENYGRRVNALVQYADEGRVGLRKARMSCRKAILIRDVRMG